jgi:hypothetical protein
MIVTRKSVVIGAAASLVASVLGGCGDDNSGSSGMTSSTPTPPSTTSTAVDVTTAELLLTYAREPSETGSPVQVNDAAFAITDTSDTTTPVTVNAN